MVAGAAIPGGTSMSGNELNHLVGQVISIQGPDGTALMCRVLGVKENGGLHIVEAYGPQDPYSDEGEDERGPTLH